MMNKVVYITAEKECEMPSTEWVDDLVTLIRWPRQHGISNDERYYPHSTEKSHFATLRRHLSNSRGLVNKAIYFINKISAVAEMAAQFCTSEIFSVEC